MLLRPTWYFFCLSRFAAVGISARAWRWTRCTKKMMDDRMMYREAYGGEVCTCVSKGLHWPTCVVEKLWHGAYVSPPCLRHEALCRLHVSEHTPQNTTLASRTHRWTVIQQACPRRALFSDGARLREGRRCGVGVHLHESQRRPLQRRQGTLSGIQQTHQAAKAASLVRCNTLRAHIAKAQTVQAEKCHRESSKWADFEERPYPAIE